MNKKVVNGDYLLNLGFKSGKWFKEAINHINKNQLSDEDIKTYMESIEPVYIEPLIEPVTYHVNISGSNDLEKENIASVVSAMDFIMKSPTMLTGSIMPDACPVQPGHIPVGGVAVTDNAIHPAMHSADICCSVMMTNFGSASPKSVLDAAHSITHFGPGGRSEFSQLPKNLKNDILDNEYLSTERSMKLAKDHLGTQGDGNHFLFVGVSKKTGETIMVTHHGSRGFGAYLYTVGMKIAERFRKEISPRSSDKNPWIPYNTKEGVEYWDALQKVREWTKLNHSVLHNATAEKLRVDPLDRFWNEHNFVFKEENKFYHAKGATPLDDKFVPDSKNGLRLIPLNMSQPILIVKGTTSNTNLGFAPHGAGRNLSRGQHKKNLSHKTVEQIFKEETAGLDVRFFSKNIDISELPSAYKNAELVKQQMIEFGLGQVVDEIIPYGCIMAGDWQNSAPWRKNKR